MVEGIEERGVTAENRTEALESRVAELEHDLVALATLLGNIFGEPMKSKAKEIVSKRQVQ